MTDVVARARGSRGAPGVGRTHSFDHRAVEQLGDGGPPVIANGALWSIDRGSGTLYGLDLQTGSTIVHFAFTLHP